LEFSQVRRRKVKGLRECGRRTREGGIAKKAELVVERRGERKARK
jgi:hypothetical protein